MPDANTTPTRFLPINRELPPPADDAHTTAPQAQETNRLELQNIPTNILITLLSILDPEDLASVHRTCQRFHFIFARYSEFAPYRQTLQVPGFPLGWSRVLIHDQVKLEGLAQTLKYDRYCNPCKTTRTRLHMLLGPREVNPLLRSLHCVPCGTHHAAYLFHPSQRHAGNKSRECVGWTGRLKLCSHTGIGLYDFWRGFGLDNLDKVRSQSGAQEVVLKKAKENDVFNLHYTCYDKAHRDGARPRLSFMARPQAPYTFVRNECQQRLLELGKGEWATTDKIKTALGKLVGKGGVACGHRALNHHSVLVCGDWCDCVRGVEEGKWEFPRGYHARQDYHPEQEDGHGSWEGVWPPPQRPNSLDLKVMAETMGKEKGGGLKEGRDFERTMNLTWARHVSYCPVEHCGGFVEIFPDEKSPAVLMVRTFGLERIIPQAMSLAWLGRLGNACFGTEEENVVRREGERYRADGMREGEHLTWCPDEMCFNHVMRRVVSKDLVKMEFQYWHSSIEAGVEPWRGRFDLPGAGVRIVETCPNGGAFELAALRTGVEMDEGERDGSCRVGGAAGEPEVGF